MGVSPRGMSDGGWQRWWQDNWWSLSLGSGKCPDASILLSCSPCAPRVGPGAGGTCPAPSLFPCLRTSCPVPVGPCGCLAASTDSFPKVSPCCSVSCTGPPVQTVSCGRKETTGASSLLPPPLLWEHRGSPWLANCSCWGPLWGPMQLSVSLCQRGKDSRPAPRKLATQKASLKFFKKKHLDPAVVGVNPHISYPYPP